MHILSFNCVCEYTWRHRIVGGAGPRLCLDFDKAAKKARIPLDAQVCSQWWHRCESRWSFGMVSVGIQHGDLKGATTEETSLPTPKFPKSTSFPMTFCRRKGENFSSSFPKPKPPGRSQQTERLVLVKVFGLQAFVIHLPFSFSQFLGITSRGLLFALPGASCRYVQKCLWWGSCWIAGCHVSA